MEKNVDRSLNTATMRNILLTPAKEAALSVKSVSLILQAVITWGKGYTVSLRDPTMVTSPYPKTLLMMKTMLVTTLARLSRTICTLSIRYSMKMIISSAVTDA